MTDDFVRCPYCQRVLRTAWKALTAVERAKQLHERQLKHFAEVQRRPGGVVAAYKPTSKPNT